MDHLLGILSRERRGDQLFVQLYRDAKGVTVRGREISETPPSVLDVLGGGAKVGESGPVKGVTLVETVVPTGRVVNGCEQATLTVLPYRPR